MDKETINRYWLLVGPLAGLAVFLTGTATMDGVYRRPNIENKMSFSMRGLWEYLKAPFQYGTPQFYTVWGLIPKISMIDRFKMLQLNWIATLGFGFFLSFLMYIMI
jgi:hypothetical protein